MGCMQDKIALVTGASRGIGAGIAERFAAEGATVILAARSLDTKPDHLAGTLEDVADRIRSRGGKAIPIACDLASQASRREMADRIEREVGDIDILVNNAASAIFRPFTKFSDKHVMLANEINFLGPWELCHRFVPGMQRRGGGWILNITSYAGDFPSGAPPFDAFHQHGGFALYGATKAAMNRMTVSLAAEFYDDRIVANALAPLEICATPGVVAMGIDKQAGDAIVEPIEAMAEAAFLLCTSDVDGLNGRIVKSLNLLREEGQAIHALDGEAVIPFEWAHRRPAA